jgi:hypothetical protein
MAQQLLFHAALGWTPAGACTSTEGLITEICIAFRPARSRVLTCFAGNYMFRGNGIEAIVYFWGCPANNLLAKGATI